MPAAKKTAHKSARKSARKSSEGSTRKSAAKSRSVAKKSGAAKKSTKRAGTAKKSGGRRWVRTVTTDSTHPAEGLFKKSAQEIARALASKKVSPKGPGSGMRMLTYFLNRGGKGLSAKRRKELERAKKLLHERVVRDKEKAAKQKRAS